MSALQPMQLQACDMEESPEAGHHAAMLDQCDRDCCDPEDDQALHGCVDAVSCGSCTIALTLLHLDTGTSVLADGLRFTTLDESGLAPPHYHPPFRPPIV